MFNNKSGQVGETVTWLVATVIIVVILSASIFVSTIGPWGKKDVPLSEDVDYLTSKSFFSYVLTEETEGTSVYNSFKEKGNFTEFSGELALKVFDGFYGEEYLDIWVGVNFEGFGVRKNDYFGNRPVNLRGGDLHQRTVSNILEEVLLTENKTIELALAPYD